MHTSGTSGDQIDSSRPLSFQYSTRFSHRSAYQIKSRKMAHALTLRSSAQPRAILCRIVYLLCVVFPFFTGCMMPIPLPNRTAACDPSVPREHNQCSLSTYRVMPPDILLIEAIYNIRPSAARLRSGDQITIRLLKGLPLDLGSDQTRDLLSLQAKLPELQAKIINGPYTVGPDGAIDLGPAYGKIAVEGLTVDESKGVIDKYLHERIGLREPQVSVVLTDLTGRQVVAGQHLVRPDGTVGLGIYGDVHVAGMTLAEIRQAIESHLAIYLNEPIVSVDVLSYNSKVYYIVLDGGGYGEQIVRLPCTGNETVLDAIAKIDGLPQVSSKRIWIARPCPEDLRKSKIIAVNWQAITADGIATTNYQLMPGDRIYIQADSLIAADNFLAKLTAPLERIFGTTLLGVSTAQRIQFYKQSAVNGGGGQ
jgi:polysaccharide export outer membrane protein